MIQVVSECEKIQEKIVKREKEKYTGIKNKIK